jgi:hypothetical protein
MSSPLFYLCILVSLLISLASACSPTCRAELGLSFVKVYASESRALFGFFTHNLTSHILDGVNVNKVSLGQGSKLRSELFDDIRETAAQLEKSFAETIPGLVEDAIFNQSPEFRGECSVAVETKLVQFSASPRSRDDCMIIEDVCGSALSICRHLDLVKERTIKTIVNALDNDTSGEFYTVISRTISRISAKWKLGVSQRKSFISKTNANLKMILAIFSEHYKNGFCSSSSCNRSDEKIIELLLDHA